MTTSTIGKAVLAVALSLSAGGAFAQANAAPVTRYEAPVNIRGEIAQDVGVQKRPLTVMGMTGGIEPKDPEATGSIEILPQPRRIERLR